MNSGFWGSGLDLVFRLLDGYQDSGIRLVEGLLGPFSADGFLGPPRNQPLRSDMIPKHLDFSKPPVGVASGPRQGRRETHQACICKHHTLWVHYLYHGMPETT